MNKRPGVAARFAHGDELEYLRAVGAAASHMYLGGGASLILVRQDVATRLDALHEWLHRRFAVRDSGLTVTEEHAQIEAFLDRHRRILRLE
jgi:hypothetical protein